MTNELSHTIWIENEKGERLKRLKEVRAIPATLIFYESPHRLQKSLIDCLSVLGNRRASVARELTKLHEEIKHGSLLELSTWSTQSIPKGEIVIIVEKMTSEFTPIPSSGSLADRVAKLESEGVDQKTALKKAARESGLSKSEAYRILQREKDL